MDAHMSMVTLGVTDLERSTKFYKDGLGLPLSEHSQGDVAFFELRGAWLGLYPKDLLAEDAGVSAEGSGFTGVAIAHNVKSKDIVDHVMAQAAEAGAKIVRPAEDKFWGGYSGYFADPDGYLWEVAWNPFMDLT